MNSESVKSEKLSKLIDLIKSKKADREAAKQLEKTLVQSHKLEGNRNIKRDSHEAKSDGIMSSAPDQNQKKEHNENLPKHRKEGEEKAASVVNDKQSTATTETIAPIASATLLEEALEFDDNKQTKSTHTPKSSPTGISSKENPVVDEKQRKSKNEAKEMDKKNTHQQQSVDPSTQHQPERPSQQHEKPQNTSTEDRNNKDTKQEHNAHGNLVTETQSKEQEKVDKKKEQEKQKKVEGEQREKDGKSRQEQNSAKELNKPKPSQSPTPALSEGVQEKTQRQNEMDNIDEGDESNEVDKINTEVNGDALNPDVSSISDEVVPKTDSAAFFEGYGIAAGHAEDEFGGLGLIGVFEDITSTASKTVNQQLYIMMFIVLATWFMIGISRR